MWTTENRHRYDRDKLRYPSDLTDAEWQLIRPLIPPAKRGGGKREYIAAARSPPRSDPANSHAFLPRAIEGPFCPYQPRGRSSLSLARAVWPQGPAVLRRA